jgi:hypothetical protein
MFNQAGTAKNEKLLSGRKRKVFSGVHIATLLLKHFSFGLAWSFQALLEEFPKNRWVNFVCRFTANWPVAASRP